MLARLTARLDEQNEAAESPNKWASRRASKNIESGGQTYEADDRPKTSRGLGDGKNG